MKIEYFIEKEREGQYFTIPFDVPENVIKITVSYDYHRPTKGVFSDLRPSNCIDIGLSDESLVNEIHFIAFLDKPYS